MHTPREWIDAGAWVGRQQAFAVIANKCSAAQALCLNMFGKLACMKRSSLHGRSSARSAARDMIALMYGWTGFLLGYPV